MRFTYYRHTAQVHMKLIQNKDNSRITRKTNRACGESSAFDDDTHAYLINHIYDYVTCQDFGHCINILFLVTLKSLTFRKFYV